MIARLRGQVVDREKNSLIIELGGVGLRVFVPEPMRVAAQLGEPLALFTHLHVRDSELAVYGFGTGEELSLFELLLSVSGVGPKVALALLSAMSDDALRVAIGQGQPERLTHVPGIGKRTAEKIVFELKGRMPVAPPAPGAPAAQVDTEVIDALTTLGYSVMEAQKAVQGLPRDVSEIEEKLRLALAAFAKP
jgi:Holliday junction DNA helicase RuvA